jgi:hypothetical protein
MNTCQCCGKEIELEEDGRVKFHFSGLIIEGFTNVCLGVRRLPVESSTGDIPNYISAANSRRDFIIAEKEQRNAEEDAEIAAIAEYVAGRNAALVGA